jgi:hypothetical protein
MEYCLIILHAQQNDHQSYDSTIITTLFTTIRLSFIVNVLLLHDWYLESSIVINISTLPLKIMKKYYGSSPFSHKIDWQTKDIGFKFCMNFEILNSCIPGRIF